MCFLTKILILFVLWFTFFNHSLKAEEPGKIAEAELEGKSLQELWLMRNEIFARHGKPFRTYELFAYFMGKGYKPDKDYSEKRLSVVEMNNAKLILKKENELLKRNYIDKDGRRWINFDNVLNEFQFPRFTKEEIKKLSPNGFIITPAKYGQLFHVYEENDYYGIPSFITTDTILQLYHVLFSFTLRRLEKDHLSLVIEKLSKKMIRSSKQAYLNAKNSLIKEAARRNLAYFSVPCYFIKRDETVISPEVKNTVKEEIKRCSEHSMMTSSVISNPKQDPDYPHKIDYTQFVPRGHYTRSKELANYFMAMMWLGTFPMHSKYDVELAQALLITHQIYNDKYLTRLWEELYEPTVFYVGLSDDFGPNEFKIIIDRVFGRSFSIEEFANPTKLAQVRKILEEMFEEKTKIKQIMVFGQPYEIQFRFMGQRYIPDSEIMQRLVKSFERAFPKGLDVMAVFGSRVAKELMLTRYKEDWKDFPKYPQELEKLTEEFKKLKPEEWKKNLYYNWLWCLKSLLQLSKEYKYPFFMNNDAYLTKSLNSALASWTELRHDTILYAKQSYCAECGGEVKEVFEWIPKPPKGYVEPNIEFYKRMEELLIFSRDKLKKYNALGGFKDLFERFIEVVAFLKNISTKEIDNRPLTLKEYEQIRRFGSLLDNLTLSILEVESDYPADWGSIEGPDKRISLVVDVHTAPNRDIHGNFPGPGAVLEEAVGDAFEIYVIVEIDGRLKLTRGAVFSYYEFKWPMDDRLTDEKWQEILEKGKEPPLPDWIDVYFSKSPKKLPKPAYIPTMEVQEKIGKEQPGWYMIYYETGS